MQISQKGSIDVIEIIAVFWFHFVSENFLLSRLNIAKHICLPSSFLSGALAPTPYFCVKRSRIQNGGDVPGVYPP